MSTQYDLARRYERAARRAEHLGWTLRKDSLQPLYLLESVDQPGTYRPPGSRPRFAFTLDDIEQELNDVEPVS